MKKKALITISIGVFLLILAMIIHIWHENKSIEEQNNIAYIQNQGEAQGTTYSAIYQQPDGVDLKPKIEKLLHEFDMSLSSYIPNSVISRINRNDTTVRTDQYFETMFNAAREAADNTNGAIDITVGPLVKAWGFAFGNSDHSKISNVAEYLPYIGYKKVKIENHRLIKEDSRMIIDCNSIAQGYSADLIAQLLEDYKCKNYLIEIGGEIACKGLNPKGLKWQIGIDKPIDDSTSVNNQVQTTISITDCAVTTAGDYRKFFTKGGKKYSHIINPHTGYPVDNKLLSVTIIAPKAIIADAYDTPFMVLGVDSALKVCKKLPGVECYMIYADKDGKHKVICTDGFKKYLNK